MVEPAFQWGTGRRKSSVARVRLKTGSGNIVINDRTMSEYFNRQRDRLAVTAPLRATKNQAKYDIIVRVNGGGIASQAGAISLGIARALTKASEEFNAVLRDQGLLTRDGRRKERKKYGRKGARKGFQFSKR